MSDTTHKAPGEDRSYSTGKKEMRMITCTRGLVIHCAGATITIRSSKYTFSFLHYTTIWLLLHQLSKPNAANMIPLSEYAFSKLLTRKNRPRESILSPTYPTSRYPIQQLDFGSKNAIFMAPEHSEGVERLVLP